jgi:PIN domain nuclease of toxin-antitoxin system
MRNRFLLDTNILAFIITGSQKEISFEVQQIIDDYNNVLETSTISIKELIHLFRKGKIQLKKGEKLSEIPDLIENQFGIKIVPFTKKHINFLANLNPVPGHNDPDDFAIISHAISDKYILVSSDTKFIDYKNQKLEFIYNKK